MTHPPRDRPTPLSNELFRPTWAVTHLALLVTLVSSASAVAREAGAPTARHAEAQWRAFLPFDLQQPAPGYEVALGLDGHSLVAWRDASSAGLRIASAGEASGTPGAGEFLSELAILGWREVEGRLQLLGLNGAREVVLEELDLRLVLPDDPIVIKRSSTVLQQLVPPDDPIVAPEGGLSPPSIPVDVRRGAVVAPHAVLSPPYIPVDIRRGAADSRFGFQSLTPELDLGLVTSWSEDGEFQGGTLVSLGASGHPSVPAHARAPGASAGSEGGPAPGPIPIDILRAAGDSALAATLRDAWLENRQLRALVERESVDASAELVLLSAFLPDDLDEPLAVAERVLFERDGLATMPGTLVRLRLEAAGGDTVGSLVGWSSHDDSTGGDEPSGLSWTYVPDIPIPIEAVGAALPAPPFPIDTERGGRDHAGRHVPEIPEPIDFGTGDASIGTLHVTLPSPTASSHVPQLPEPIELLAGLRVAEVVVSGPEGRVHEARFDHSPDGRLSAAWWSDGQVVRFHGLDASSLPAVLLEGVDAEPIAVHLPALPADVPLAVLLPGSRDQAPDLTGSIVPEIPEDILRVPSVPSPVFGELRVHLPFAIEPPFESIDGDHRGFAGR